MHQQSIYYPMTIPNTFLPMQSFLFSNTINPYITFPLLPQKQYSSIKKRKKSKKAKQSDDIYNTKEKIKMIKSILQNPDSTYILQIDHEYDDSYNESDDEIDETIEANFLENILLCCNYIHPHLSISNNSILIIDLFLKDACEKLVKKALHYNHTNIGLKEIESTVNIIYPGELAKFAVKEGNKASLKYEQGDYNKRKSLVFEYIFKKEKVLQYIKNKKLLNGATIDEKALVFLTACIEFLCYEIIEHSVETKIEIIKPEHIKSSLLKDEELKQLFSQLLYAINNNE